MRKLVLMALITVSLMACESQEKRDIDFTALPQKSQQFVNLHFADKVVSVVLLDKELFDKEYKVIFTDGSKIEFDKEGEWQEVECKFSPGVPLSFLPTTMAAYLEAHFVNTYIENISIDHRRYEVELNNDIELVFDLKGNFLYIDD